MGGHLPGSKVTPEIADVRGKKVGEDIQSPSRFPEITNKDDLRAMVTMLRERSEGRPVGIKISAGNIEKDLEYCVYAEPENTLILSTPILIWLLPADLGFQPI